jgi:hypothetical protein
VGTTSEAYVVERVWQRLHQLGYTFLEAKLRHTWKTPHETPHIASPQARTGKEGANTGMKIITAIHAMKAIMVARHPKRS